MKPGGKNIDIETEIQSRVKTREPGRREKIVMIVNEFARQPVSTNVVRAAMVNGPKPNVTGQAIVPQT